MAKGWARAWGIASSTRVCDARITFSSLWFQSKREMSVDLAKFRLVQTSNAGRALVATSDIAASQLIIRDVSSVVAPIMNGDDGRKSVFCFACFKILSKVDWVCLFYFLKERRVPGNETNQLKKLIKAIKWCHNNPPNNNLSNNNRSK